MFVLYCLVHSTDVIIDHAISTPGNGKDAGDGLYANEKNVFDWYGEQNQIAWDEGG